MKTRLTKSAYNRLLVRAAIHEHAPISRIQLGGATGLPLSALTDICADLIKGGFVCERASAASITGRGRRRALLDINRAGLGTLCLVYDRSCLEALLADLNGEIRWKRTWPGPFDKGKDHLLEHLCSAATTAIRECGMPTDKILALGVGDPGIVDSASGVAIRAVNLAGWRQVPIRKILGGLTGMPVILERVESLRALGERNLGGGRGCRNQFYMELTDDGISGAIIIDGHLVSGRTGNAGEIGHIRVAGSDALCACGLRGCLEAQIAPRRLAAQWRPSARFPEMLEAARGKDAAALKILVAAAEQIASVLGGTINLLNPECIVFGGYLAQASDVLLLPLREALPAFTFVEALNDLAIRPAELSDSAAKGLADLVREKLFLYPNRLEELA